MADQLKTNISNPDIQDALRQFEASSDAPSAQPNTTVNTTQINPKKEVSGISFETDSYAGFKYYKQTDAPKIINFVVNYSGGLIKDQRQAYYVVFALILVIFSVSIFLFLRLGYSTSNSELTAEELEKVRVITNTMINIKQ